MIWPRKKKKKGSATLQGEITGEQQLKKRMREESNMFAAGEEEGDMFRVIGLIRSNLVCASLG